MTSRIIRKSAAVSATASAIVLAMLLVGCDSSGGELHVNDGDVVSTYQVAGMT